MTKYTEALINLPNSPHIHFNIGNAAYKKEDYEEAIKSYTKAASLASDSMMESKAYYNLGNCKYRQGKLKENSNLGEAISLCREALEHYKQALDRNPEDTNAKYNHEFVERKIKELLDKREKEVREGRKEEQEKQQNQKGQPEKDDKSKEDARQKDAAQLKKGQKSERKEGLKAEEAKMLLDSLKDEELSRLLRDQDRSSFPEVLKDW